MQRTFILTKAGEPETKCTMQDKDIDIGIAISIWKGAGYEVSDVTEEAPRRR